MNDIVKEKGRIEVVDALRGFAVMAIILVHNLEHFIFPVYPEDSPGWLMAMDEAVFNGVFALFAGKAYDIFALLFGFTFYIQTDNQRRRGKDLRADEPHQLYHAVGHRRYHIFPDRLVSRSILRIHAQSADRSVHVLSASPVQPMVAVGPQAGTVGDCLAQMDMVRY